MTTNNIEEKTDIDLLDLILSEGACILGISLRDDQRSLLISYLLLLAKWNMVYNLTAIRNIKKMLIYHILDSLSIVQYLSKIGQKRILDVGSGCGLPGAVLAIVFQNWEITLNDSVQKKSAFQMHVKYNLKLENLSIVNGRVEKLRISNDVPGKFGIIVSRAFTNLSKLITLSRHLMAPECSICVMKGKYPEKEITHLPMGSRIKKIERLLVPMLNADRYLIELAVDGNN